MDKDMGITSGKRSQEQEKDEPMPSQGHDPVPERRPKLTTEDSLQFMWTMKCELASEREKYNEFIAIMLEFKDGGFDLAGLVDRVMALFAGHPKLIRGFKEFLPLDYARSQGRADGAVALSYEISDILGRAAL